ncbi:MAG: DUF393 domain-containing protein [Planctomycetota bacterium]
MPSPNLPPPDERPGADVVLYDGQCNFCRGAVERLRWWEGPSRDEAAGRLAYLSLHDPVVAERYPDVSIERLHEEMCVVTPKGERHWGADAVRQLARRLARLAWLRPFFALPGAMLVARPAYRFVARNRYRIAGRTMDCESGACSLPR